MDISIFAGWYDYHYQIYVWKYYKKVGKDIGYLECGVIIAQRPFSAPMILLHAAKLLTILFLPSAYLIGISNCTWSSCRHGCTAEVYKCWQVQVSSSLLQWQPLTKDISLCIWSLLSSELKSQLAQVDIYHIQARPHYHLQL